jgi:hypothetical protein
MATKQWPSLPEWASGGTKVEPSPAKKASGWVGGGEKPPYQTFNWWQDNVYENITYIQSLVEPYPTLQEAIESTFTGTFGGASLPPRYVQQSFLAPLTRGASVNLGPIGEASADLLVCADGRYVCTMTAPDTVSVYNQKDLTLFTTITLAAPPVGNVFDIKSNGFYVAVAYDGKIDLFDISTQALEHTYVHVAGPLEVYSIELLSNNYIIFAGNAANGSGSTPGSDNVGIVDDGGALVNSVQIHSVSGALIRYVSWWNGNIACYDATNLTMWMFSYNSNAPSLALAWYERWREDLTSDSWTYVRDIALNATGVMVVGDPGGVPGARVYSIGPDTQVPPGPFRPVNLAYAQIGTGVGITWVFNLSRDETRFFLAADENGTAPAGEYSNIFVFDGTLLNGTNTTNVDAGALIKVHDFEFDSTDVAEPGTMVAIATDYDKLYVLHEKTGGGDETLYAYGLGTLPKQWNVSDRIVAGDGVSGPMKSAYPTGR